MAAPKRLFYKDEFGCSIEVYTLSNGSLWLETTDDIGEGAAVKLNNERAEWLRDVLTHWLETGELSERPEG